MPYDSKILVVDDNEATRYAVRRVLERHGFGVAEAGTAGEGLAMLSSGDIAAVLLDVNLPDMSGFDVVRQLRADDATRLLPVVHVSAASIETRDLVTGLDAGADAYLVHPIDHDVLLATLRTLLRVRDAEEAMIASEARLRDIFSNIAAPIAVIDTGLRIQEANAAFFRLFEGADPASIEFGTHLRAGQERILDDMRAAIAGGRRWKGTLVTASGRDTEWRITPYRVPELGLLFIEDVTEQKQRERQQQARLASEIAQRERTESQLVQMQKMDALGKLTGGIAHDFNNMLTSIMSGVDMINVSVEQGRIERIARFTGIVSDSAHRAAALTQRMLAFARQQPLDPQSCDVNERVRSLEDMLRRTIGEHIDLALELTDEEVFATADVNQLENVIINLVINARDALDDGGTIRIVTQRCIAHGEADVEDGDYVSITVADDGTGVAPELLDKVFEPFFTTKPIGQGTGLGLSMTYGFARQSGGTARIESEPGVGTRLQILLPASHVSPPQQQAPGIDTPLAGGGRQRILLVDDNDMVRQMVGDILTDEGYVIVEAGDAQAALVHLRDDAAFDLLLTDVGLPGMSGRELADLARQAYPLLPIVFMTGYTQEAVTRGTFAGTGMTLLQKPFSMRELLEKIGQTLA